MLNSQAGRAVATELRVRTGATNWFFVCMACVLLLIVAVGFAKSFYEVRRVSHNPVNHDLGFSEANLNNRCAFVRPIFRRSTSLIAA